MNHSPKMPPFLWHLFERLRRRGFVIAMADYDALRQALKAGFGWTSKDALRDLCSSLWAKSRKEEEILFALFDQLAPDLNWNLSSQMEEASIENSDEDIEVTEPNNQREFQPSELPLKAESRSSLPSISLADVRISERPFVFVPQFPLTYREVAQAWRRLRRPVRSGPSIELDIDSTIAERSRLGIATSVKLRPRRRNVAKLLILVDRQGSMAPFHSFCDEVCTAIQQAGRLEETAMYYFHNTPVEGSDEQILEPLIGQLFPSLDSILSEVQPLISGYLFNEPELLTPSPVADVLETHAVGAFVVLISDAGASKKRYQISRLLDTVAFIKALRKYTSHYIWLNPLPKRYWANNTAAQVARHVPMFPLDREGLHHAINVLRGQQFSIERPV